jgi:DNA repair protein RadC
MCELTETPQHEAARGAALYFKDEGGFREASPEIVLAHAQDIIAAKFHRLSPALDSLEWVRQFLQVSLAIRDRDTFAVLHLDRLRRVIAFDELFHGTVGQVDIHVREVVRAAIHRNAYSIICARTNTSGCSLSTAIDRIVYERLMNAFGLLDTAVLDYVIVGETISSFAELGLGPMEWEQQFDPADSQLAWPDGKVSGELAVSWVKRMARAHKAA